jgi:hypothetical protein
VAPIDVNYSSRVLGQKKFELTNHLGNVLAVVSDKKVFDNQGNAVPDVKATFDYFPFGMTMPGRFSYDPANDYRFGFNTQERETEITGTASHYFAEFWMYDGRLGRRWNLDPKYTLKESRYAVNGNNPIIYLDLHGDFKTKFGANLYKLFNGGSVVQATSGKRQGEWYVSKKVESTQGSKGRGKLANGIIELDEVVVTQQISWNFGKNGSFHLGNTVDNAADWHDKSEFYFDANGKVDIGVQLGGHVEIGSAKIELDGSLMTADLFKLEYNQTKESGFGLQNFGLDYIGKDGGTQISQYFGASYFGGVSYEHSFRGKSIGYENQTHTVNINVPFVKYQIQKPENMTMTQDFSISFGGRASFILGVEGNISFGVRDKQK